jgi:hypothetical protein
MKLDFRKKNSQRNTGKPTTCAEIDDFTAGFKFEGRGDTE